MPFTEKGELCFYYFESLDDPNLNHAIFTRQGGCSPYPWMGLNVGGLVGDHPSRVEKNRLLAFDAIGRDPDSMYDVWQVHGNRVIVIDRPRSLSQTHFKADAIVTNNSHVTLFMRFADCVPILLYDPELRVIGLVHAGWQGTIKKISENTVKLMSQRFGCKPVNIRAGIGPSICRRHYEVGPEIDDLVKKAFSTDGNRLMLRQNGKNYFDLWEANRLLLEQAGLHEIELSGLCTYSDSSKWFSHRREKGITGRFAALMGLVNQD